MKAAVLERPGLNNLKIEQLPTPEPGPGEVLVRLRAASLNYRDTLTVVGGYGSRQKQERLIPLSDGAGEVASVGVGVQHWRSGDRVIGCLMPNWQGGEMTEEKSAISLGGSVDGCAAEYRLFPATGLVRTPEHLSDIEAATLPCAALTAWSAVVTQGGVGPGDIVLTQGTGGVSLFALTAWACLLPIVPMLLVSAALDGVDAALAPILAPSWRGWLVLFYTVVPVMWLGYWLWGTLLRSYPAAKVGPVSLLVPCCALGFASLLVGETIGGLRLAGVIVVLGGVAVGMFATGRRWR